MSMTKKITIGVISFFVIIVLLFVQPISFENIDAGNVGIIAGLRKSLNFQLSRKVLTTILL